MLHLHNESGNIWSHLAPALLMVALALGGQLQAWQGAGVAFWANLGSILACFLGSVVYHTFQAHHHCHDRLLKLDVSGVEGGRDGGVPRRLDLRSWRRSAWPAGRVGQAVWQHVPWLPCVLVCLRYELLQCVQAPAVVSPALNVLTVRLAVRLLPQVCGILLVLVGGGHMVRAGRCCLCCSWWRLPCCSSLFSTLAPWCAHTCITHACAIQLPTAACRCTPPLRRCCGGALPASRQPASPLSHCTTAAARSACGPRYAPRQPRAAACPCWPCCWCAWQRLARGWRWRGGRGRPRCATTLPWRWVLCNGGGCWGRSQVVGVLGVLQQRAPGSSPGVARQLQTSSVPWAQVIGWPHTLCHRPHLQ